MTCLLPLFTLPKTTPKAFSRSLMRGGGGGGGGGRRAVNYIHVGARKRYFWSRWSFALVSHSCTVFVGTAYKPTTALTRRPKVVCVCVCLSVCVSVCIFCMKG